MEGINAYPDEFVKPLLISLGYFKRCNILFFDSNPSFWVKYWRLIFVTPIFILYYASFSLYIVKVFTEGIHPFEKPDMIPMWLILTQVIDKSAKLVAWQYFLLPLVMTVVKIFFLAQDAELALPFACVYPFAVDSWPKYLAVYVFQVHNEFKMVYMFLGTYTLLVELSTYLSIQFLLLQEDLIHIKPTNLKARFDDGMTENCESNGYNIEEFVRRHQDVILLTQNLNAIFNKIVFVNLLFSTLIICFFAVAARATTETASSVNYYASLTHVMMSVLVMCYCSEMLSASSTGIAHSAFKNLWYKGDLRYQTIIRLIILRSQKPCTLRSLNYTSISMKTFNRVLRTTYSYFSLASQLFNETD